MVLVGAYRITAGNAAVILSDLYGMAGELDSIVGGGIVGRLFGGGPSGSADFSVVDKVLDKASPLTIAILNIVADAVAQLTPRQQGYIMGLVSEQVVEWAIVTAATDAPEWQSRAAQLGGRIIRRSRACRISRSPKAWHR